MSLSCSFVSNLGVTSNTRQQLQETYGHLLLRQNNSAVLSPHAHRHDVCCRDCLEGIFWDQSANWSLQHAISSRPSRQVAGASWAFGLLRMHTDLVQSTIVGKDGNVSIVSAG